MASIIAREMMSALVGKAILGHDKIDTSMIYIHNAEDKVQQQYSPMEMAGIKMKSLPGMNLPGETKGQLLLEDRKMNVEDVKNQEKADLISLVGDLFPVVPDDVKIRTTLNTDDLNLIKAGMIALMGERNEAGSGSECVRLIQRMLRKV